MTSRWMAWMLGSVGVALAATWGATASELQKESSPALVDAISKLRIMAESTDQPFLLRVAAIREDGECDGTPESCPMEICYLAVSNRDLDVDRGLFVLKAAKWSSVKILSAPAGESRDDFFVLELTREVVAPKAEQAKRWFKDDVIRVRINPWSAFLEE